MNTAGDIATLRELLSAYLTGQELIGDFWATAFVGPNLETHKCSKKYSQMKLQMKREALDKINRRANEMSGVLTQ